MKTGAHTIAVKSAKDAIQASPFAVCLLTAFDCRPVHRHHRHNQYGCCLCRGAAAERKASLQWRRWTPPIAGKLSFVNLKSNGSTDKLRELYILYLQCYRIDNN